MDPVTRLPAFLAPAGDSPDASEAAGATSHFLRFSLVTLVGVVVVVVAMAVVYRMIAIESLIHDRASHNVVLGRSMANSLMQTLVPLVNYPPTMDEIGPEAFRGRPEVGRFEAALQNHIHGLPVVRVKVYSTDGRTLYSSITDQIGTLQVDNEGVVGAVRGRTPSKLVENNAFNPTDHEMAVRDLFETYLSFTDLRSDDVAGVLEIYTDVTPLLDRIRVTQRNLVIGSVIVLSVFYVFLGGLYRRADRAIRSEEETRVSHLREMEQARDRLEERVRARTSELDSARGFLQAVIDGIPDPVLVLGLDYRIRSVNHAARDLVAGDGTIVDMHCFEVSHGRSTPCDEPDHPCPLREVLRTGQPCTVQHRHLHKGQWRHVQVKVTPLRDSIGAISGLIEVSHDISELVEASEKLRESENNLRTIMDSVVDAILTVDAHGRVESANRGAVRLFGVPVEMLTGRAIAEIVSGCEGASEGTMKLGTREGLGRCARGDTVPLDIWVGELRRGNEPRFILVARDITERRRAEQELEQTRRQYFHQEKMAAVGQLAAGIIHEVGNPIAAISGAMQEIRDHHVTGCCPQTSCPLDAGAMCNLVLIEQQTERLAEITHDIAEFASPRSEKRQLVNLNELIRSAVKLTRYDRRWQGIRLQQDFDPELPAVMGMADKLTQVMINLLLNAADACEGLEGRSPSIRVSTRYEEEGWVHVAVGDNGEGMTPEMRDQAFDAFYTTKAPGKGTGLGLSLCQTFINAHHGSIWLDSERGAGTTVHLRLPAETT